VINPYESPVAQNDRPAEAPTDKMTGLRIMIYFQIGWLMIFIGVMSNGFQLPASLRHGIDNLIVIIALLAMFISPVLVGTTVSRKKIPTWKKIGLLALQCGLTIAYFIALLPSVQ